MPRPPRPIGDGLVYQALNRGNNRAAVFCAADDYLAFLQALAQTKQRYPFRLFGYCLMTNHFHLVLEPAQGQKISRILQSLTVAHTGRYHRSQGGVGHVWQGRFRSPVIQDDAQLLTLLRYVESNPLRAGMVTDLASYPWSSYLTHGLGKADSLVDPVADGERGGKTEASRQAYWRGWLHTPLTDKELERIRRSVTSGRLLGEEIWVAQLAQRLGLTRAPRRRGRPPKQRKI